MIQDVIKIKGAYENNLKHIDLEIPKYKLVALTGVSGSGKSTLAMDVLQRECQRQYLESLGMLADNLNKPHVHQLIGLSPSISISQRALGSHVKSTVGTYTEILTFLRILYAKIGVRECVHCQQRVQPVVNQTDLSELDQTNVKCPHCKKNLQPLTMANFSFNKLEGACPTCQGFGVVTEVDLSQVVDENLSVGEGAFVLWRNEVFGKHYADVLLNCANHYGFEFDVNKKVKEYNELERLVFYQGVDSKAFQALYPTIKKPKKVMDGYFKGIQTFMKEKATQSQSKELKKSKITTALVKATCPDCEGARLNEESRHVTIDGLTLPTLLEKDLETLAAWLQQLKISLNASTLKVVDVILVDAFKRIENMIKIGLGYLTLNREVSSLSGGESQRLKLANIIDSALTGVIYILDEPTTGLHPQEVKKLLAALTRLKELGNTVIVIEHDVSFIKACDYQIEIGPGAGVHGGEVVAVGTPDEIMNHEKSVTGPYLRPMTRQLQEPAASSHTYIRIEKATAHHLKHVTVDIPLHQLVCFTGPSGSGKSTLLHDVLYNHFNNKKTACEAIHGLESVDHMIQIDQKAIGRLSRSNTATYTEMFTFIRELFTNLESAKKKKLKISDFSFNVKGGRCEHCQGLGVILLDMQFLDDVEVTCPVCQGQRFKTSVLEVKYNGFSISDILNLTVDECLDVFKSDVAVSQILEVLSEVGLGYLKLGQSTTTLSGGECQRIKLAKALSKKAVGHTVYLFDEPTSGLHPKDIKKLLAVLRKLQQKGHSVFVIEHSEEVMIASDYIIDLGPVGGVNGGQLMVTGSPQEVMKHEKSETAKALRAFMQLEVIE